ncbi:Ribosomal protein S10p/S20e family protein isoform 1 [Hibiscus syriacus]|uniref:pectinesterase n=1 Tax=Hibiscus syriacus TaxID=106335 RepID=A0A6A3CE80_HIBSY|nr:Ribosomal protein S10p/S20e family protein isoform 1 [Hibiscus syriacus]
MVVVAFSYRVGFSMTNEVHVKKFIGWDDIEVDEHQIKLSDSRVNRNRSRVIVVNKNGGADSVTVQGAIDMVPENNMRRVKIFILPGTYLEKVTVPKIKPYISFVGNAGQMSNTIISWGDKASDKDNNGISLGTYRSASVTVLSDYFCATDITFENLECKLSGDTAMFYKVKVVGTQDTWMKPDHITSTSPTFESDSLKQDCGIKSTAVRNGAIAAHRDDTGF